MRRLFLAAGVASLAIAGAAAAKPGNGNGGGGPHAGGGPPAQQQQGGGNGGGHGGGNPHFQPMPGGGSPQAFEQHGHGGGRGGGGFAPSQMQRVERQQMRPQMRMERQAQKNRGFERQQMRIERQAQNRGFERQQMRAERMDHARDQQQMHMRDMREAQNRAADHRQMREQRVAQEGHRQLEQQQAMARQQFDQNRVQQVQNNFAPREDGRFRVNQQFADDVYGGNARGFVNGCPPGLAAKNNGCLPPGQAAKLLGTPLSQAAQYASFAAIPQSWSYLYPDTSDYYYRYGDGYLAQVDRNTNLIDNLMPLLGGGYLPGQYLPQPYMASYVPDYYGLDSFYPDYGQTCNRYGNGVVYQVDCATGMVEDVVPLYANGYGVGQMLPASYAYYNVPTQYRDLYYDTPNSNYWYAPGAIYQYDPQSSMITSVAALLSPGFSVGQPLPAGYAAYNVPYDYRSTYYDTDSAWYRYNNGNIYQVDPVTQVVTALVASLLT
jgi:hypothetical protein